MKFILTVIISIILTSAYAAKPDKVELINQLHEAKDTVRDSDEKRRQLLQSLYSLDKNIKRFAKKNSYNSNKVLSAEANVKKVARSIADLKQVIKKNRGRLGRRLKAMYMFQNLGALRLILSSEMGNIDKNIKYLKNLSKRDIEVITTYLRNLKQLNEKQEKLNKNVKILLLTQRKFKKSEKILISEQKKKKKLLSSVRSLQKKKIHQITEIKNQYKEIYGRGLGSVGLYDESFFEKKGKLTWPILGAVRESYGLIYNYEYNYKLKRNGIYISPESETKVHSVFSGVVTYVGDVNGYGMTVIVNHGDKYFTVYSKLSNVLVNTGQELSTGEQIAQEVVQFSDEPTKSLYFEVRHYSESVDPEKWLGKKVLIGSGKEQTLKL